LPPFVPYFGGGYTAVNSDDPNTIYLWTDESLHQKIILVYFILTTNLALHKQGNQKNLMTKYIC